MRKSIRRKIFASICILLLLFGDFATGSGDSVQAATDGDVIVHNEYDSRIIPDKYNTGVKGALTASGIGQKIGDIQLAAGNSGTANVLDFKYRNTETSGTVVFENLDFSQYTFAIYNSTEAKNEIRLVFRNCKFSTASVEKGPCPVFCVFENCTFNSFYGGNASFNRCHFGGSYTDGIVPFQNVQVNNCYFSDMTSVAASGKEVHTDGTQIYGKEGLDATNISFSNCRFELPALQKSESTAYVNACIMLQMEYSNANGISFTDCIVNGGGYSVYAWSKTTDFTIHNIRFSNIRFGCSSRFGRFYSRTSPVVVMDKMWDTSSLYVGSVWKKDGATHFSVSNDTNQERKLLIYTDKGVFEQTVKACPKASEFTSSMTFAQMPFDIDVSIPADCNYAVCYDVTVEGFAEQLRYMNWSGETVSLTGELKARLFSAKEEVLVSGSCGKEAEYVLTNTGVLTIMGKGGTDSYHSGKMPPWSEFKEQIKEIRVEKGIESLGNQMFRNYTGIRNITLPEGLRSIGGRTFEGCTGLEKVTLPGTLQSVGDVTFSGTIQSIYFNGSDWSVVALGKNNESWAGRVVCLVTPTSAPVPTKPVATPTPVPQPTKSAVAGATPTITPMPTKPVKQDVTPTGRPTPTKAVVSTAAPTVVLMQAKPVIQDKTPTASPIPKKSGKANATPTPAEQLSSNTVTQPAPTVTLAPFVPDSTVADEEDEQEIIRRENEAILNEMILKQEREATFEKVWLIIIGGAIAFFLIFVIVSKKRTRK